MTDHYERIAIVETKVEDLEDNHKELLKLMHEIKDQADPQVPIEQPTEE